MSDTDSFFESGGSGFPAFKFSNVGDKLVGTITKVSEPFERQTLNGNETRTVVVIELHTDAGDDYALWCDKPALKVAIAEAVREAGEAGAPKVGGRLGIEHHASKPSSTPGYSPQKLFRAGYKPPAGTPATNDFFGDEPAPSEQPAMTASDLV